MAAREGRDRKASLGDVGPDSGFVGNPVTIQTTDGRHLNTRVDIPRGDASLPLTDDELLEKFRDCARLQSSAENIARSVELVRGLEKLGNVEAVMGTLEAKSHS